MRRTHVLASCLVAAALGAGLPLALASGSPAETAPDRRTSAVAPEIDPVTVGLRAGHPTPGTVGRVAGPFDDRFTLTDARLSGGVVTGQVSVTSDVSALLDLQVLAGFYDARGLLLGTAAFDLHGDHETRPGERVRFSIRAPQGVAAQVSSAAVGVPVLVNE